jgi:hypothetical protein
MGGRGFFGYRQSDVSHTVPPHIDLSTNATACA